MDGKLTTEKQQARLTDCCYRTLDCGAAVPNAFASGSHSAVTRALWFIIFIAETLHLTLSCARACHLAVSQLLQLTSRASKAAFVS